MKNSKNSLNRRNFIKNVTAAGVGSVIATSAQAQTDQTKPKKDDQPKITRRKLGKTGVEVPILGLGMMFDVLENQIMLHKAHQWGVTYWDTAGSYQNGKSELGIGKFFKKNPEKRKDIFLVTKGSGAGSVQAIEAKLKRSLDRMNTDHVDIFYWPHGCNNPAKLTPELKKWIQSAKERKLIRLFGFSTHQNMAKCMNAAAKLDFIDVIMSTYNFRQMQIKEMNDAVQACHDAGIAIIAMKTQAKCSAQERTDSMKQFIDSGYTEGQAKIKAVLQDKRITSACVGRGNLAHLSLNIAAVLDKTKLSKTHLDAFKQYAQQTCTGYCAGCAEICAAATPQMPRIASVMRYLMYYNSYDEHDTAKELFAKLPDQLKVNLTKTDYSKAQSLCPQHLPIAKLMAEAAEKLA